MGTAIVDRFVVAKRNEASEEKRWRRGGEVLLRYLARKLGGALIKIRGREKVRHWGKLESAERAGRPRIKGEMVGNCIRINVPSPPSPVRETEIGCHVHSSSDRCSAHTATHQRLVHTRRSPLFFNEIICNPSPRNRPNSFSDWHPPPVSLHLDEMRPASGTRGEAASLSLSLSASQIWVRLRNKTSARVAQRDMRTCAQPSTQPMRHSEIS